jgi:hypothetical protein
MGIRTDSRHTIVFISDTKHPWEGALKTTEIGQRKPVLKRSSGLTEMPTPLIVSPDDLLLNSHTRG